jgi:hypothetical protein
MSFPERRYEFQCACDPIFGIQPTIWVEPNASVPIIPNIGSRCRSWVNHPHIAFQKTTCPSGNFLDPDGIVNYFWDGTAEVVSKPQIRLKGKAQAGRKMHVSQHTLSM